MDEAAEEGRRLEQSRAVPEERLCRIPGCSNTREGRWECSVTRGQL